MNNQFNFYCANLTPVRKGIMPEKVSKLNAFILYVLKLILPEVI